MKLWQLEITYDFLKIILKHFNRHKLINNKENLFFYFYF